MIQSRLEQDFAESRIEAPFQMRVGCRPLRSFESIGGSGWSGKVVHPKAFPLKG